MGPAEFEDLNGGCPKVDEAHPRPSYMVPINPSHDPWSWYRRVLTFQARALALAFTLWQGAGSEKSCLGAQTLHPLTFLRPCLWPSCR